MVKRQTFKKGVITACLLFVVAGMFLVRAGIANSLLFLFFLFAYILLPGFFLASFLKPSTSSETYALSFALGISLNVISYIVCYTTDLRVGVFFIAPMVGIGGVWKLVGIIKERDFAKIKVKLDLGFWLCFMLAFSFIAMSLPNLSPDILGSSYTYVDSLWNISNTNAFLIDFPPPEMRMSGNIFQYHYLAFMFRAIISIVTRIPTTKVFFVFTQFVTIPFAVFSIDAVANKWFKNKEKSYLAVPVLYFCTCVSSIFYFLVGPRNYFGNISWAHFVFVPNGMDFAIPLSLAAVLAIIKVYKKESAHVVGLFFLFLLSFSVSLSKGPTGVMLVGTVIVIVLFRILQKRDWKRPAVISVFVVGGFILSYLLSFSSINSESANIVFHIGGSVSYSGIYMEVIEPIFQNFCRALEYIGVPYAGSVDAQQYILRIVQVLLIPIHFVGSFILTGIPFAIVFWKALKNFKKCSFTELFLLGLGLSGVVFYHLFSLEGGSQAYFLMSATPFVAIVGIDWILENYATCKKYMQKFLKVALVVSISSTLIFSSFRGKTVPITLYSLEDGLRTAYSVATNNRRDTLPQANLITEDEYEAMTWIQKNTPQNAIFATNRHYLIDSPSNDFWESLVYSRYYYYSAYSGRQFFLEGFMYMNRSEEARKKVHERFMLNDSLYQEGNLNRIEIMRENNIDYLLVSKYIDPDLVLQDEGLVLVFSNRDIDIYQRVSD